MVSLRQTNETEDINDTERTQLFFLFFFADLLHKRLFLRQEAAQEHFNLKVDELKRKPMTDHPWERFHYDLVEQNLKLFHHLKKTVITENCYQQVPPTT